MYHKIKVLLFIISLVLFAIFDPAGATGLITLTLILMLGMLCAFDLMRGE